MRVQKLMGKVGKVLEELGLITYVNAAKLTWAVLDREMYRSGLLCCAVLCHAVRCCAVLCHAVLCGAVLC